MKTTFVACFIAVLSALPFASALHAQTNVRLGAPSNGPGVSAGPAPGSIIIKAINLTTPNTPEYTTLGGEGQAKRYTLGKWLEVEVEFSSAAPAREMTFHYNILLANTLLVGEVTHVDVPAGQSLFSVMYVSPRTISTMLKGQPLLANSVQNVDVQVQRPGVAAPLADKMLRPGPPFYTTMQQVPNLVLNKAQTPFAQLWWDRYEAIKATTGGN